MAVALPMLLVAIGFGIAGNDSEGLDSWMQQLQASIEDDGESSMDSINDQLKELEGLQNEFSALTAEDESQDAVSQEQQFVSTDSSDATFLSGDENGVGSDDTFDFESDTTMNDELPNDSFQDSGFGLADNSSLDQTAAPSPFKDNNKPASEPSLDDFMSSALDSLSTESDSFASELPDFAAEVDERDTTLGAEAILGDASLEQFDDLASELAETPSSSGFLKTLSNSNSRTGNENSTTAPGSGQETSILTQKRSTQTPGPRERVFTDASGQHKIEAAVLDYRDGRVQLKSVDTGRTDWLNLNDFSQQDQTWLRAMYGR